ncbi:hypothetical protein DACRYDRAFT_108900 [Dacryopinax primogenitus]|uniref:Uncharacterized protein n=1 Tax=Dacryopinax primogenitus (strain DJM 731) TaxID=1858805 RepID=M5G4Q7_DACPD|nr:uncharacterized protein DACRYDRAFT_108900 [Dacryopinax primogenitus]EJU00847.1 hypothetical protein DACRYDRAFT_108900 [Dacryopinax primogenitus]
MLEDPEHPGDYQDRDMDLQHGPPSKRGSASSNRSQGRGGKKGMNAGKSQGSKTQLAAQEGVQELRVRYMNVEEMALAEAWDSEYGVLDFEERAEFWHQTKEWQRQAEEARSPVSETLGRTLLAPVCHGYSQSS